MAEASDIVDTARTGRVPGPAIGDPAPGAPGQIAAVIRMPRGLPGFPEARSFVVEPVPGLRNGLMTMKEQQAAEPGFVVLALEAWRGVFPGGEIERAAADLAIAHEDLTVFLIVTLVQPAAGPLEAFVNLRAPLLIDLRRLEGSQVVLANPAYPLRQRLQAIQAG